MEKQTLIAHCLTYPNAVEDYPFADNDLTIMRHPSGGKWFACIMHLQGKLCINLKCDPVRSELVLHVIGPDLFSIREIRID